MRRPARDRAGGGDQRLPDHLTAEHALPADLRAAAAEQIHLERFEVENRQQILDGGGHAVRLLEHDPEKCAAVSRLREAASASQVGKACPRARPEGSCSNEKL